MRVDVCNDYGCFECNGGARQIHLEGRPGWNYINCEDMAASVRITLTNFTTVVTLCEIQIIGQKGYFSLSHNDNPHTKIDTIRRLNKNMLTISSASASEAA